MARILLTDDEPMIRELFRRVLEHDGHETVLAANGREALTIVADRAPDLILVDLTMPVMDGLGFLRVLRANRKWKQIPVIVLTAMSDRQNILAAKELGVQDYLLKADFSMASLRDRVGKYVAAPAQQPVHSVAGA